MASKVISDFNQGVVLDKVVADATALATPLLNRLLPTARLCETAGGPTWNFRGAGFATRTHSEGAAYPTPSAVQDQRATVALSNYDASGSISDEAISRANLGNPDELKNRSKGREIQKMVKELVKAIEVDFHATMRTAIDDTASYAGVSRSNTAFNSYVYDNTISSNPGALTSAILNSFVANADRHMTQMPSFGWCGPKVFERLVTLNTPTLNSNAPVGTPALNVGFNYPQVIYVGGVPVFKTYDGYESSTNPGASDNGELYMAGPDADIHIEWLPYDDDPNVIAIGNIFGMQILQAAKTSHATQFVGRCQLALVVKNPFKCAKMKNIKLI